LSVDSPATGGVTLTQVHGWKFHVDFALPSNSTLGVGANHSPNANITVNGFIDAFTNSSTLLVPQNGTAQKLDTLGDKIMTPVVYQNRAGVESLWASQTVLLNYPNGPTAVRWYQFNVTGGNFPATPVQQQSWNNGNDGLWRWMPSIAVDQNGNMAIGYSTSSATQEPSIRYAGRLATDPLNNLGQGEAIMTAGGGHQTHSAGRWGDYSMTTIDPVDNLTFWHTNEYFPVTSSANWFTRIGKFKFPTASPTPTPTATATATVPPSPTVAPSPPAAPRALSATNVTVSSFTANWSTVAGATGYRLDVATNNSFTNFVPGYQNLDVGNTTNRNVSPLAANTFYYYRLRAYNGNGTSPNSNVIKVKTKNR
jgi:hypothetical protein